MKTRLLIVLLTLISACGIAQDKGENSKDNKKVIVPGQVKKEFSKRFPAASKIEWGLEKAGEYEVEFVMDKKEMSVVMNEKGDLLELETVIKESELPQAVENSLSRDFAGYKIKECEKTDTQGLITYEMVARKNKEKFELIFDTNGKLISKEEIKEKDNE